MLLLRLTSIFSILVSKTKEEKREQKYQKLQKERCRAWYLHFTHYLAKQSFSTELEQYFHSLKALTKKSLFLDPIPHEKLPANSSNFIYFKENQIFDFYYLINIEKSGILNFKIEKKLLEKIRTKNSLFSNLKVYFSGKFSIQDGQKFQDEDFERILSLDFENYDINIRSPSKNYKFLYLKVALVFDFQNENLQKFKREIINNLQDKFKIKEYLDSLDLKKEQKINSELLKNLCKSDFCRINDSEWNKILTPIFIDEIVEQKEEKEKEHGFSKYSSQIREELREKGFRNPLNNLSQCYLANNEENSEHYSFDTKYGKNQLLKNERDNFIQYQRKNRNNNTSYSTNWNILCKELENSSQKTPTHLINKKEKNTFKKNNTPYIIESKNENKNFYENINTKYNKKAKRNEFKEKKNRSTTQKEETIKTISGEYENKKSENENKDSYKNRKTKYNKNAERNVFKVKKNRSATRKRETTKSIPKEDENKKSKKENKNKKKSLKLILIFTAIGMAIVVVMALVYNHFSQGD